MRNRKRLLAGALSLMVSLVILNPYSTSADRVQAKEEVITLRVCNWEEYIDLGDWEEGIDLDNGVTIFGENPLYEDFEEWYYENYGVRVKVEYSCFGTNEDLYNQLTMGDTFDLVCPSDYMIMKLMAEEKLEPFSDDFYDKEEGFNYYATGVSPYIADVFQKNEINQESWSRYAACYMWGITGILYNPEYMTYEEAATWGVFENKDFYRQLTLKDNVRDTYFAALGYYLRDELMDEAFLNAADYQQKLAEYMNDVSYDTIQGVEEELQTMMGNIYALETDSGKADILSGKIVGGYQWSGDAVYSMDLAEENDIYLEFAVPEECTNLWFDGWVMLKNGIDGDPERKQAAEAFVNFVSRPDNAVRNMNYIGYTSSISGGEDDTIIEYINWCYGAEDEDEEVVCYPIGYFFTGDDTDERYMVEASSTQINRQLYTQYPSSDVIYRAAVMGYFNEEETKNVNQMWINIRCYNITKTPAWVWGTIAICFLLLLLAIVHKKQNQLWKDNR